MFNFFKRIKDQMKQNDKFTEIFLPVDGKYIPIEEVKDDVFSKKMMGDGYAVVPANGKIYSPVYGTIKSVFPTKHAFGITTKNNDEIILHLGIDTVELNGEPFTVFVKEGDEVTPETLVAEMDLGNMNGKDPTVIVVFANQYAIENIVIENSENNKRGEKIGKVVHKGS